MFNCDYHTVSFGFYEEKPINEINWRITIKGRHYKVFFYLKILSEPVNLLSKPMISDWYGFVTLVSDIEIKMVGYSHYGKMTAFAILVAYYQQIGHLPGF